jgi:hypothetical protein
MASDNTAIDSTGTITGNFLSVMTRVFIFRGEEKMASIAKPADKRRVRRQQSRGHILQLAAQDFGTALYLLPPQPL